jgi:diguanylate cyclase (GGDEF)-like protein
VSSAIAAVVRTDLVDVARSFHDIADGDLSSPRYVCTRTPITDASSDELGSLAESYNELIAGLHEMAKRIDESVLNARRRKEAEERLAYLEQYDEITGLANRHLFRAQLDRAVHWSSDQGESISVAYLGLQGLKKIEDSFGRVFREQAVQMLARRLSREVRKSDIPARAGDDEFVVALTPISGRDEALGMVRRLMDELSQPLILDGHEVLVNVRAGVSIYPDDGHESDELMRNANTAMSYARQSDGGDITSYSPQLRTQSLERLTIESELRRALDSSEFEMYYQPIVDVAAPRIVRFEALLRWRHPRLGLLEPASFLDVVEETAMIVPLGSWVLRTACAQVQEWRRDGHDVALSVNVSMRQFRGDLVKIVSDALASTGLPSKSLELELTESAILTDRLAARAALASLKQAGVSVAIDDFGTGYSSFAYLQSFPLDTLKIDRSFVTDITRKPFDEAIARTIILLAQSLGMRVIAEGVEDAAQASTLHRLGCRMMQGFFFGRPCPAAQSLQLLQTAVT